MGRPPLAPGTHGRIGLHHDRLSGRVRARARFRDYDGLNRAVTRWGATEAEARARLLDALTEQAAFPVGQWAAGARLREVVPLWQADLDGSPLAPSTRQLYRAAARLYVTPALGESRLGEPTPALLDLALGQLRLRRGPQQARAARRALSCPACAPTRSATAPSPTTRCATRAPSPAPTTRSEH